MDIAVLGTSNGVTDQNRTNTSILMSTDTTSVLIDASGSPGYRFEKANVSIEDLDAVLLTHEHTDHMYGLPSLVHHIFLKTLSSTRPPLNIYGTAAAIESARKILKALNVYERERLFQINMHTLDYDTGSLSVGDITLEYFPVDHIVTDTIGISVDHNDNRFVYSCDTEPCREVIKRSKDSKLLVHECNNMEASEQKGHTTLSQFLGMSDRIGSDIIRLVHLPKISRNEEHRINQTLRDEYEVDISLGTDNEVFTI